VTYQRNYSENLYGERYNGDIMILIICPECLHQTAIVLPGKYKNTWLHRMIKSCYKPTLTDLLIVLELLLVFFGIS